MAIVDPPYGIGAGLMTMGSGRHKFKKDKGWDSSIPDDKYFKELFRISVNQIIWGGNYFTEHLKPSKNWIVWDKLNPNLSFAEGELAWVNNGNNLRIYKYYSARVEIGGKIHPTEKPIDLYKWLFKNYAKPDFKILDTHGGSMSSVIAMDEFGCDYVVFEIDKEYFCSAMKRIKTARQQLRLL